MSYPPSSPPSGYHIPSPSTRPTSPPIASSSSTYKRPGTTLTSSKLNSMNRPTKSTSGGRRTGEAAGRVNPAATGGSRTPSIFSSRSRPNSMAGSEIGGPARSTSGRGRTRPAGAGPGSIRAAGRTSRPGSFRPIQEYSTKDPDDPHPQTGPYVEGGEGYDEDEDEEEGFEGSDYGDQDGEGEGEAMGIGAGGKGGIGGRGDEGMKRVLTVDEERLLGLMKERDEGMEELRRTMMDKDQQKRYDEYKSTNFTFQSIQKVYRDRYPGAGHIAKNVAGLIGVVAKAHVGEIIELAKTIQLERMKEVERLALEAEGSTSKGTEVAGKASTGPDVTAVPGPEIAGSTQNQPAPVGAATSNPGAPSGAPEPTAVPPAIASATTTTPTNPHSHPHHPRPKPKPLTANDLKEAYAIYLERTGEVRGTVGGRMGEDRKVGLFGGWM